ncbi:MAG TPA: cation diffusion facilitator family transporter, partial [Acidimicrobiales bacterium]
MNAHTGATGDDEHQNEHHDEHRNDHGHGQGHEHHDQGHGHGASWWRQLVGLGHGHTHDSADRVDQALEASAQGIRALKVSLVGLGITAVLQAAVVVVSGSVALLGDTLHNVADALTALPLWVAFGLGKRPRSRRYPYGYGRAEDLAGLVIVVAIALSAAVAGYESFQRLLDPTDVRHLGAVAAASVIGFIGNEVVAQYRI